MIDMNIIFELIEKASKAGTAVRNSNGLHYDAVDHGDSTYICVYEVGEQKPFLHQLFQAFLMREGNTNETDFENGLSQLHALE